MKLRQETRTLFGCLNQGVSNNADKEPTGGEDKGLTALGTWGLQVSWAGPAQGQNW